jgi:hypothetical protein
MTIYQKRFHKNIIVTKVASLFKYIIHFAEENDSNLSTLPAQYKNIKYVAF